MSQKKFSIKTVVLIIKVRKDQITSHLIQILKSAFISHHKLVNRDVRQVKMRNRG